MAVGIVMGGLYRLVYSSKNLINAPESIMSAEVDQILAASQRNNAKVDVTGALLFNRGGFAQVLEGPQRGVEATFERIQRDLRHADVTVLQCGPVEERGFTNWSMAFVGQSSKGRELWNSLAARSGFDLSRLDGDEVFTMLHGFVLEEEGVQDVPVPDTSENVGQSDAPTLDTGRLRAEIDGVRPDRPDHARARPSSPISDATLEDTIVASIPKRGAPKPDGNEFDLPVLRLALADERQRTTELRNELDEAQIALAKAQSDVKQMRQQRDLWAERARLLATVIGEEAAEIAREAVDQQKAA